MNTASTLTFLANHLWQTTLFAGVVAGLVACLRQNAARIRFCLWLAASLKFLVPFSVLVTFGSRLARNFDTPPVVPVNLSVIFESLSRPFITTTPAEPSAWPPAINALWLAGSLFFVARAGSHWLNIAGTVRRASISTEGPAKVALRKAKSALNVQRHLPVVVSTAAMEPGLFGILRPVLVLPSGLETRLTAPQLETVMTHELCHLRRRDNLWAALHTAVQSIFWFHPLVWWLTARLVDERERACDEAVLDSNGGAQAYAEAMITICKHYMSAPLKFVSGVTGSRLERRIEAIMTYRFATKLDIRRKLLLAAAATLTIAGPVLLGVLEAHTIPAATVARLFSSPAAAQAGTPGLLQKWLDGEVAYILSNEERRAQTGTARVFQKWLNEDVVYIISEEERRAFENLRFDEEREHFIENFWLRRDPTPGTPENEFKEEHFERIAYANSRFAWAQPGWTTDRGRIMILLGKPYEIESHPRANPGGNPAYPYETWGYQYVEGLGNNVRFTFVDPEVTGEYRLLSKFR
jgi:GWxTD domain-containing protein